MATVFVPCLAGTHFAFYAWRSVLTDSGPFQPRELQSQQQ